MPLQKLEKPALTKFFEQYEDDEFKYDCMMPASQEFKRLTQHIDEKEPNNYHSQKNIGTARFKFGKALTTQFTQNFGDELDSLDSWQALCEAVKMDPIPDTLEEAQVAFKRTHVNLVDLTEAGYNSDFPITLFPTVKALSDYTLDNDAIFPRRHAKEGGLLCHLLRNIRNPEKDDNREGSGRGGRGHGGRRGRKTARGRTRSGKP